MYNPDTIIPDYVAVAHGDMAAAVRLSVLMRGRVLSDEDDPLTGSMEGATLARLAAIRGDISAALLMAEHLLTVAELYEAANDHDAVASHCAEAVAILELADNFVPEGWTRDGWSDHVLQVVTRISTDTSAAFMDDVKFYRNIWSQFLSSSPHPVAGEAQ